MNFNFNKSMLGALSLSAGAVLMMCVLAVSPKHASPTSGGRTVTLRATDDLQAALNAARYGDTIVLPAGATFAGPFVLPFKPVRSTSEVDYITIRTADLTGLAPEGVRIKPEVHQRAMPRIVAPQEQAAITTEAGAHHYRFIGIEFQPAQNANYVFNVIDLGSPDYSSLNQFPHHLIFDRCYVHSTGLNRARRGFALNSADTEVINSYISGFAGANDETQAIAAWNTPGPLRIVNNYLEGAGEVVLIGGGDPSIANLVPSDIEIRRNFFRKPKEWLGRATIKGTLELKNARRVLIEGNLIESEILTTAVVLTVRNQGGKASWSTLEDVAVQNNIVRHASTGINILARDNEHKSQEAKRIRIENNLIVGLVANEPNNIPYFIQTNGGDGIKVSHNTVQQDGNIITAYGSPTRNFVFRDNIVQLNSYGIVCQIDGMQCGSANLFCNCYPGGVFKGNVFADNLNVAAERMMDKYPVGNYFVGSYRNVGFVDYVRGNWRLAANSPTRKRASDGGDPGLNVDVLIAAGALTARNGDPVSAQTMMH